MSSLVGNQADINQRTRRLPKFIDYENLFL